MEWLLHYSSHVWITDWTLSVLGSHHSLLLQVALSPKKSRCSINVCQIGYPLHTHRHTHTHMNTYTHSNAHTHTPAYSGKSAILPHFGCPTVFLNSLSIPYSSWFLSCFSPDELRVYSCSQTWSQAPDESRALPNLSCQGWQNMEPIGKFSNLGKAAQCERGKWLFPSLLLKKEILARSQAKLPKDSASTFVSNFETASLAGSHPPRGPKDYFLYINSHRQVVTA